MSGRRYANMPFVMLKMAVRRAARTLLQKDCVSESDQRWPSFAVRTDQMVMMRGIMRGKTADVAIPTT